MLRTSTLALLALDWPRLAQGLEALGDLLADARAALGEGPEARDFRQRSFLSPAAARAQLETWGQSAEEAAAACPD